jgi:diguanylate cyclase (GGDEF)-like protein
VILLTGTHAGDAAAAVQALRLGAHDFIAKDATASDAVVLAVQRALDKWRLRDENARLLRELRRQSLTDGLTGAWNRRALDRALAQEVARARRSDTDLSLVLLDLDHFKKVNDEWGHAAGDAVLVAFSARLQSLSRGSDRLFRYGGEEFALLLGDTDAAGALALARRAVEAVAAEKVPVGSEVIRVTCSAGAALLRNTDDDAGLALVARADAALYAAKGSGRNRACSEAPRPSVAAPAVLPGWPVALLEDRC